MIAEDGLVITFQEHTQLNEGKFITENFTLHWNVLLGYKAYRLSRMVFQGYTE